MVDEADKQTADAPGKEEAGGAGKGEGQPKRRSLLPMLIVVLAVAAVAAFSGFGAARLLVHAAPAPDPSKPAPAPREEARMPTEGFTYFDLEPITVNLDDPRLARYIRLAVTLAVKDEDHRATLELLENRKIELKNWLTMHMVGCSLEDVRGQKSFNRLQREIQDKFNEMLWPDRKPRIDHVIFKEFAVQ